MPLDTFFGFLAAAFVLMLIPGPSVMLAIGVSLSSGLRLGMANVVGAVSAVAVQVAILAVGLTPLLIFASNWFEWLRWAGVAYLFYLGVVQWWRSRRHSLGELQQAAREPGVGRAFWHGFAVSALNPKSLLFFAAVLPQFLDPARPAGIQLGIVGLTLVACAMTTTTLWTIFADRARRLLKTPKALTWRDRASGSIMIAGGIALALAKR